MTILANATTLRLSNRKILVFLLIFNIITASVVFTNYWTSAISIQPWRIFNRIADYFSQAKVKLSNFKNGFKSIGNKSTRGQYYAVIDNETYPKFVSTFHNQTLNFTHLNELQRNKTKVIVLWNTWYSWKDWKYGLGKSLPFEANKCPVTNCELTYDRSRLNETDLVMFSGIGLRNKSSVPVHVRNNRTRLVLFNNESPQLTPNLARSHFNGLFDLVAYNKRDSDFAPFYYADIEFEWVAKAGDKLYAATLQNATSNMSFSSNGDSVAKVERKFAVALISNCNTVYSNRFELIEAMRKHVEVDVYGKCGLSCNIANENR
jgi:hypothetical protein